MFHAPALLAFAVLISALPAPAQGSGRPDSVRQVSDRMDQIVQSYVGNHQFMGSVLVARGDRVLLDKGYGSANLEWNIPNSPDTKFRLGSITKQFTAASIMLLEERGKLDINDPVRKYMPDAPAAWDKITIFHLLTHTSGIPSFTGFPDYRKIEPFATTAEELVARFREKPLEFEPGTKWSYDNSGYVLLTYLIEKISGESYAKFVQENIFAPLGMNDSGYDSNSAVIPRRASGYTPGPKGIENAGYINMTVPQGAGALYSTTEDLLKWERGLFGGKLLRPESLAKMTTPFKENYAFGLQVETVDGLRAIRHDGGIEGFNTHLAYYPEDKLTVIVLGNLNGSAPASIGAALAAVAHGKTVTLQSERKEVTLSERALEHCAGAYELSPGTDMLITVENNQLISRMTHQGPVPLFAESETKFFPKVVDAELEFSGNDAQGRATELTLRQNGREIKAKRVDDAHARQIADTATAVDKRVKDQTAAPGSEQALRRLLEELRTGKPNYDLMSPGLAAATRQQLAQLQSMLTQMGAVQSVTFKGVGPAGADIYQVKCANGSLEYRIWVAEGGRIESANVRPQ